VAPSINDSSIQYTIELFSNNPPQNTHSRSLLLPTHQTLPQHFQYASHQPIPSRSRVPQVHQLNYIRILVVRSARIDSHITSEPKIEFISIASKIRIVDASIEYVGFISAEEIRGDGVSKMMSRDEARDELQNSTTTKKRLLHTHSYKLGGIGFDMFEPTYENDKMNTNTKLFEEF
jgi:hypothetical protein